MKKLLAIAMALPSVGCVYMGDRAKDFADIFRVEASVGAGLQADVTVGELAHLGVGSSRRWSAGIRYGEGVAERRVEDHFPLSYVWTLTTPDTESLHSLKWGDATRSQHRCYTVVPGELGHSIYKKDPIHYYDLELNVFVGLAGVQVGFSFGEFADFLLGWFGVDIAHDDGPNREHKQYWRRMTPPDYTKPDDPYRP